MADGINTNSRAVMNGDALPLPQAESISERLQRLEKALAALQAPAAIVPLIPAPSGFSNRNGASIGSMIPAALTHIVMPTFLGGSGEGVRFWARFGVLREVPLMFRMYFDSRYRISRISQLGVPIVIGLMVMNYLLFAFWSLPLISLAFPILERLGLIVLAVILYKLLSREAARYDDVLNYLSRYTK